MKLCIPVLDNTGLHSAMEPHFPHANTLLIFDTESRQHHYIDVNSNEEVPAEQALIDAVLCGSINRHTLRSLLDQGIQIFGTVAQTALEAVAIAARQGHGHGRCGCHGNARAEGIATKEHECCGGHGHGSEGCGCRDEGGESCK